MQLLDFPNVSHKIYLGTFVFSTFDQTQISSPNSFSQHAMRDSVVMPAVVAGVASAAQTYSRHLPDQSGMNACGKSIFRIDKRGMFQAIRQ